MTLLGFSEGDTSSVADHQADFVEGHSPARPRGTRQAVRARLHASPLDSQEEVCMQYGLVFPNMDVRTVPDLAAEAEEIGRAHV